MLAGPAQGVAPDSLRRALGDVFARPEYRWVQGRTLWQWLLELWYRVLDWLGTLQTAHPSGYRMLMVALMVLLAGLVAHIGWVVWRITRPTARTPERAVAAGGVRLEDARAHRERAAALAREGRYAEAIAHRFVALVLALEQRRAVVFHPSKTPAEYVNEARLDPSGRASLAALVGRLYRHVFGAVPCADPEYRDFAAAADLVLQHVAPA